MAEVIQIEGVNYRTTLNIGEGGFAKVFKATALDGAQKGKDFAVKRIKKSKKVGVTRSILNEKRVSTTY